MHCTNAYVFELSYHLQLQLTSIVVSRYRVYAFQIETLYKVCLFFTSAYVFDFRVTTCILL